MIIDFKQDPRNARRFLAVDPTSGSEIRPPYFYADDRLGIVRGYARDDRGLLRAGPDGKVPVFEARRPIRIVPRPGLDGRTLQWALRQIEDSRTCPDPDSNSTATGSAG